MEELQQMVYISRATFAPYRPGSGIEPEVGRILIKSRRNNPRRGLVGGLYYADGFFFQCLEGTPEAIDELYAALLKDPRHRDLKVINRRSIESRSYSEWAMKYVPSSGAVRDLLKKHRLKSFDPYRFEPAMIGDMLSLLQRGAEGAADLTAAADVQAGRRRSLWLLGLAVGIAVAAVVTYLILRG